MSTRGELVVTPYGPQATEALARLVRAAQSGDPLAPVDVVVPSATAGVTLRRALADPGLANVRFSSFPQLAERLAARHLALSGRRVRSEAARSLGVRAAVAAGRGPLAAAGRHAGTAALLGGVFGELESGADDAALVRLGAASTRGAEVAELYRGYRNATRGWVGTAEVMQEAAAALANGQAPPTHVVLFAPRRIEPGERHLLAALARAGRLSAVCAALPREEPSDADNEEATAWLSGHLEPSLRSAAEARPPGIPELVLAPDAEEEVRLALRRVLEHLTDPAAQPHRVAIAYRAPVPYARLLAEQLRLAGLPHHAPGRGTLAGSFTGRALLGLLDLRREGWPRGAVLSWLRDGPILGADGEKVPAARWERVSRDAGISRGLDSWRQRILALQVRAEAERHSEVEPWPGSRERAVRTLERLGGLLSQVEEMASTAEAMAAATSWVAARDALVAACKRFLGRAGDVDQWGRGVDAGPWPSFEQAAHVAVLTAIDGLRELDSLAPPTAEDVGDVLAQQLDRPLPSPSTLGRGILCAPLRELRGADLDLLVILGMTEESFPPRLREHPLLRDTERDAAGCGLRTTSDRHRSERHDFLAAVAGAHEVVLSCPRADTRSQRAVHPSPWFMDAVVHRGGAPVPAGDLPHLHVPWLSRHDSFEASLRAAATPVSVAEYDVRLALAGSGDVLALLEPRYERGRRALRERLAGAFSEWEGNVGPLPAELAERAGRSLSATSLESWAECPRRHFLGKVLGVRPLEDPGEADTVRGSVRGTLLHEVLERFIGDHLPAEGRHRPPDAAWTPEETGAALALLDQLAGEVAAAGRAGRALLWRAQVSRMRRALVTVLALDSRQRRDQRSWPVAVELTFGRDGAAPVTLHLPRSGAVELAGSVDRVDVTRDGGLVVTDYKTGGGFGFDAIPKRGGAVTDEHDVVDRGRKLQLVIYSLAAQSGLGMPDAATQAYYWFLDKGGLHRGGPVGPPEAARLLEVVDVAVSGIRGGVDPANPGSEDWQGWSSCKFCDFDRACPAARGERWQAVRRDPAVADYRHLTDPPPPTDG